MKSILIPTDFSEYAKTAMNTGIALAKKSGAELFLLHVFSAPSDWNRISVEKQQEHPENEARMVEAEIRMEKVLKDKMFKGVKASGIVRPGNMQEEVLAMVKLYKCDLIIMGAHGVGESQRYFIGSHAQKILRTSPCPVLSVKKDFKPASMNKLMEAYPDVKMKCEVYNALDIEKGLLAFAEQNKVQVLAKVTHNRARRAGYDFGITETLLYKSNVPVLSVMVN